MRRISEGVAGLGVLEAMDTVSQVGLSQATTESCHPLRRHNLPAPEDAVYAHFDDIARVQFKHAI